MSQIFQLVCELVKQREVVISQHGYDELAADDIYIEDVLNDVAGAKVIEDYPEYQKGQCVLVLQQDKGGNPLHVVWGIPKNASAPAVLDPAYRPDPERWNENFTERQ